MTSSETLRWICGVRVDVVLQFNCFQVSLFVEKKLRAFVNFAHLSMVPLSLIYSRPPLIRQGRCTEKPTD